MQVIILKLSRGMSSGVASTRQGEQSASVDSKRNSQ